ncbi:hypothetical protein CEP54_012074 [Fusarium duplospermum]|uniref:Uncharacterized protein n=1 Tax=Fusarium duplospermum TaxID=1325734 RepID=A0A428PAT4_9HYPO|nr:hypothetical protein CEP54_012074 [Fusarium duplospermum]
MDDSPPSPPSRPASTGGKPPVRIRCWMVTEEAPSHDGTLCCSVWEARELWVNPEPVKRPTWGIQIYDTRSNSGKSMKQLKKLALKIYEDTWDERSAMGRGTLDRIDLYGLAMPDDTTPAERAERCKAHNAKEIATRNASGKIDFYIPRMDCGFPESGQRCLLFIDRPEDKWDEPDEGGFLSVSWDPEVRKDESGESDVESAEPPLPKGQEDEIRFYRYEYTKDVPGVMQNMRDGVEWFDQNYVDTGLVAEELREAVERAQRSEGGGQ